MVSRTSHPILLLLFACLHNCAAGDKLRLARKNAAIAGLSFTSNLDFVLEGLSELNCARHCMALLACVTFTYNVVTKTCRAHSGIMTSASPASELPGSIGFVVEWLGADCHSNTHCSVESSECFAGQCLCSPGYFYSNSGHNCRQTCVSEDLQDWMVRYPGFDVTGHDIFSDVSGTVTAVQCQVLCSQNPRCLSVVYVRTETPVCFLKDATALTGSGFVGIHPSVPLDHYQRTCA